MLKKTYLFDLDGTLTRSGLGITRSAQWAAEQMHCTTIPENWDVFVGPPLHDSFRRFCGMNDEEAEQAVALYRKRFSDVGWDENEVYPGIPHLLRSLCLNGLRLILVTSKPEMFSKRIADRFGLSPFLDKIIAPTPDMTSPDKAELIRRAMAEPGEYIMIGDRRFDIEGAKACGIESIAVSYGYGSMDELTQAGADQIANSPRELEDMILGDLPRAKGVFVTIEGVDGCGKSTQREAILKEMQALGWEVILTREPGGDEVAEKIRHIILDPENTEMRDLTEAYLYAASRAQNTRALILPAIEEGKLVLCDRYVDSSIAYQGGGRGLGPDRIEELNRWAVDGCLPDITVYLRMEPHDALMRRLGASEPDRLERETEAFFERTFEAYEALYRKPEHCSRVLTIDASKSIQEVTDELLPELRARLSTVSN